MRVLILGAPRFDTCVIFRGQPAGYSRFGIFDESWAIGGLAAGNVDSFALVVVDLHPDVVVNCIGVVKQDAAAKDPVASIGINALFTRRIAGICHTANARFIHLSTDCVFSGRQGLYTEQDISDAADLYGLTKLLGEVEGQNNLTIRTSMIGRELQGADGLLEWFFSQEGGRVRGFRRAIFSGFTTSVFAELIAEIISNHEGLQGVQHVASEAINKLDLLSLVKAAYGPNVEIEPDKTFVCDRSLDGSRFNRETGFRAPSWPEMIAAMRADSTPYDKIRRIHAAR
jgi:dTDP-4-dehydrorhamnose reductase